MIKKEIRLQPHRQHTAGLPGTHHCVVASLLNRNLRRLVFRMQMNHEVSAQDSLLAELGLYEHARIGQALSLCSGCKPLPFNAIAVRRRSPTVVDFYNDILSNAAVFAARGIAGRAATARAASTARAAAS